MIDVPSYDEFSHRMITKEYLIKRAANDLFEFMHISIPLWSEILTYDFFKTSNYVNMFVEEYINSVNVFTKLYKINTENNDAK